MEGLNAGSPFCSNGEQNTRLFRISGANRQGAAVKPSECEEKETCGGSDADASRRVLRKARTLFQQPLARQQHVALPDNMIRPRGSH